jgi:hypothetical protein
MSGFRHNDCIIIIGNSQSGNAVFAFRPFAIPYVRSKPPMERIPNEQQCSLFESPRKGPQSRGMSAVDHWKGFKIGIERRSNIMLLFDIQKTRMALMSR